MNLCEFTASVKKDLDAGISRDIVRNNALILYFIACVREGMMKMQKHLQYTIDNFSIVIDGLRSSEELVWFYNLTFREYFQFEVIKTEEAFRAVRISFNGEEEDKLRAWKAMAYALKIFQEEFSVSELVQIDEAIERVLSKTPTEEVLDKARLMLAKYQ